MILNNHSCCIFEKLIERTIRLRMKQHGIKRETEYHQLLRDSATEFNELIEAVVVTETWFFRDREPFNAFTQFAVGEWLVRHVGEPIVAIAAETLEIANAATALVEVEYEAGVISQAPLAGVRVVNGALQLQLGSKHTDCLAKEKCGMDDGCGCAGEPELAEGAAPPRRPGNAAAEPQQP